MSGGGVDRPGLASGVAAIVVGVTILLITAAEYLDPRTVSSIGAALAGVTMLVVGIITVVRNTGG